MQNSEQHKIPVDTANAQTMTTVSPSRPNERGSIQVDAMIKIFDPENGRVYLEARG
jgi:hypothetical protein